MPFMDIPYLCVFGIGVKMDFELVLTGVTFAEDNSYLITDYPWVGIGYVGKAATNLTAEQMIGRDAGD